MKGDNDGTYRQAIAILQAHATRHRLITHARTILASQIFDQRVIAGHEDSCVSS